ncbi:MAG: hypothetical protein ACOCZU_09150, partial [Planctomycetota bacterium]
VSSPFALDRPRLPNDDTRTDCTSAPAVTMLAQYQPEQIDQLLTTMHAGMVALFIFVFLAHCFFGYVLFRLSLLVQGALAGWALGSTVLIHYLRANPTRGDVIVAGLTCAVLLALAAWFLYRLVTSLTVGGAAWGLVWTLAMWQWDSPAAGRILGILAGLLLGILVLIYTRVVVIAVTALVGGLGLVGSVFVLVARGVDPVGDLPWWGTLLYFTMALALALSGGAFQQHTYRAIASRFAPEPQKKGRYGPSTKRPPLSKL